MPGLLDYISGLFGSPQYGPPAPPPTGMLTNPQGIREQALYGALGQLGAGLLAAGARRPVTQPSPLPQALAGFGPAYRQGIQTGQQEAALERQADQERRWNDFASGQIDIPGVPPEMRAAARILGPALGGQVVAQRLGRPQARIISDDTEGRAIFGNNWIPGGRGYISGEGVPSLVQGPGLTQANAIADTQVRGVQRPGQGGGIEYPFGLAGGAVGPGVTGPAIPRGPGPAIPPRPTGPRPPPLQGMLPPDSTETRYTGPEPTQAQIDGAAAGQPGQEIAVVPRGRQMPATGRAADPNASSNPGSRRIMRPDGSVAIESILPPASSQEGQREGREGTLTADRTNTLATEAENAARQVPLVQRQLQILDRGLQVGSLADTRSAIAGAIRTMGGENPTFRRFADAIMNPDEAAFRAASGEMVLARAGGSLGPGVSNADAIRFDQLVPNIRNDPAAAREVAQILMRAAIANARDAHEAYASSSRNYDPRTDPTTNRLRIMGRRYGVDFVTPDQVNPQQGPPSPGMSGPAGPVAPAAAVPMQPPPTAPAAASMVPTSPAAPLPRPGGQTPPAQPRQPIPPPSAIGMMSIDQLRGFTGRISEMTPEQRSALDRRLSALGF